MNDSVSLRTLEEMKRYYQANSSEYDEIFNRQGRYDQGRVRTERKKTDDAPVNPRVILLSLKPDPVVSALEWIVLAIKPRGEVIVGEICVEPSPGGHEPPPHEQSHEQPKREPFESCNHSTRLRQTRARDNLRAPYGAPLA